MTFFDRLYDLKHELSGIFHEAYDIESLDKSGRISHSATLDNPSVYEKADLQAGFLAMILPKSLNNLSSQEFLEVVEKTVAAPITEKTISLVNTIYDARKSA